MKLGRFELHLANDGGFRLDGGAMFGVVPKALWEKVKPADGKNRIQMTTNCPLIVAGDDLVLVDSGLGDKGDEKFRAQFALEEGAVRLPESIRRLGFDPGDVTHVILSHLHFDHCGWNTRLAGSRLVPTFPRARYWIARGEVDHARRPSERDRASYDPRNWEPLFEAGVVELFEGGAEPLAGIRAVPAPGHNADMCIVLVDGGEGGGGSRGGPGGPGGPHGPDGPEAGAVFWADLIPTAAHVPYPWIMAYDLYPLTTLENKKRWVPRAAAEGWLSIFEHDPDTPLARLVEEKPGRFKAEPAAVAVA